MNTLRILQRSGLLCLSLVALSLPACESDGNFCFLGYTSRPPYDTSIRTVRVRIAQNETFWRGLEMKLTKAVIREIESKTPYIVVSGDRPADTELFCRIVSTNKGLITMNQLGEIRESQTFMAVVVKWKDLRPGCVGDVPNNPFNPNNPVSPIPLPLPDESTTGGQDVVVQSMGTVRPELGQSITSSRQDMVNRLATDIVSMMEKRF